MLTGLPQMVKHQMEMRLAGGGIKDEDHVDEAAEMADWTHDGEVIAAAMLRIFYREDHDVD